MSNGNYNIGLLIGARIIAEDGRFLGIINRDSFDPESISNRFGKYGSSFEADSIFNDLGEYGSQLTSLSAYNPLGARPPKVYKDDIFIAYLTVDNTFNPRIDPDWLRDELGLN